MAVEIQPKVSKCCSGISDNFVHLAWDHCPERSPLATRVRLSPRLERQETENNHSRRHHPPLGNVHGLHDPIDVVDAFEEPRFDLVTHASARLRFGGEASRLGTNSPNSALKIYVKIRFFTPSRRKNVHL